MSTDFNNNMPLEELTRFRDELTAYLDGELDAESSRKLEGLLATNNAMREELRRLEQSWELLDELPRAEVKESFTRTTVEMVAVSAAEDVRLREQALPRLRRRRLALYAAGMLLSAVAGFVGVRRLWPDPNQRLLADLPMLSDLNAYRQAEDVTFLKLLAAEKVFPVQQNAPAPQRPEYSPSLDERRRHVESLDTTEKNRLLFELKQFDALPAERQESLRRLRHELEHAPDAPRLRQLMTAYYEWLQDLSPIQRSELYAETPEERVALVREKFQNLQRMERNRLTEEDRDKVRAWLWTNYWPKHQKRILAKLPEKELREGIPGQPGPPKGRAGFYLIPYYVLRANPEAFPFPQDEDLQKLLSALTPRARDNFNSAKTPEQKRTHLLCWLEQTAYFWRSPEMENRDLLRHFSPGEQETIRSRFRELEDKHPSFRRWNGRPMGPPGQPRKGPPPDRAPTPPPA